MGHNAGLSYSSGLEWHPAMKAHGVILSLGELNVFSSGYRYIRKRKRGQDGLAICEKEIS